MKKGWEEKFLVKEFSLKSGDNLPAKKQVEGPYPVYGGNGIAGYHNEYNITGDNILIGRVGALCGNIHHTNGKVWVTDNAFVVNKIATYWDINFLTLELKYLKLNQYASQTAQPVISNKSMKDVRLFLPPLSEQKEIVEYLDSSFAKIDKLKENAAKNLEEAKALFQSALKNALEPKEGWEYCEFSKVVDSLRTGLNPRVHFKLNTEDAQGYYVTVRELKGFTFEIDSKTDRINDAAIKRINERSNLQIGDVLFSGTGTIGRTALVEEEPTWWNIKEGVYAITPNKNRLESKFLIYLFKSDLILNKIYSKASGATIRSIPMKELNKIVLPIPPLSEQQSIVSYLDSLNEKINTLQQNYSRICNECDALKQAILRQVFE